MNQSPNMMANMLGSGMANQAANQLQLVPLYKQYVVDMQASGQEPLPFDQWKQLQNRM